MSGWLIVPYIGIGVIHLFCAGWVCSEQKQPVAVQWCVLPMVFAFWPLFFLRMTCLGYDKYMTENTKE